MSNQAWVNKADVLKDLREVNGGNTGSAHLEQYVVRGEMPPPARQELQADEEMQYHFGSAGAAPDVNYTPDLKGISLMLKMVDDLDDPSDSAETKTIFRNTVTDEISISKLNPNVNEFVPGGGKTFNFEPKSETSKQVHIKTRSKLDGPRFIRKSDKINRVEGRLHEIDNSSVNAKISGENSLQVSKSHAGISSYMPLDSSLEKTVKLEPKSKTSKQVHLKTQSEFNTTEHMFIRKSDEINEVEEILHENGYSSANAKVSTENSLQLNDSHADFSSYMPLDSSLGKTVKLDPKSKISKQVHLKTLSDFDTNEPMFTRKSDKINEEEGALHKNGYASANAIVSTENSLQLNNSHTDISNNISLDSLKEENKPSVDGLFSLSLIPNGKTYKETSCSSTQSKSTLTNDGDISLDKKLDISKMKSAEIAVMKEKVKSKIIHSSQDNSPQRKREKNVAIATLLKLCTAPPVSSAEEPVKLVTPQYFQGPPVTDEIDIKIESTVDDKNFGHVNEKIEIEQIPDTCTSTKVNQKYVDPLVEESISKVNDWFNNTGSPKPKPLAVVPIKQPIVLKKKATSMQSIRSTPKSEASSEKKDSCGNFVPSAYANDLLQKYEKNAKKQVAPKEDLGTMLERQLKQRDQQIKMKLLEKKTSASPDSGRSVQ